MAGSTFTIGRHDHADKAFVISGPLELSVDYDDVDHGEQDLLAGKVVAVLNGHWYDPAHREWDDRLAQYYKDEGRDGEE